MKSAIKQLEEILRQAEINPGLSNAHLQLSPAVLRQLKEIVRNHNLTKSHWRQAKERFERYRVEAPEWERRRREYYNSPG